MHCVARYLSLLSTSGLIVQNLNNSWEQIKYLIRSVFTYCHGGDAGVSRQKSAIMLHFVRMPQAMNPWMKMKLYSHANIWIKDDDRILRELL